jgi:hypothetical protein
MRFFIVLVLFALLSSCADSVPKISRTTTTHMPDGRVIVVEESNAPPDAMSAAEAEAKRACLEYVNDRETARQQRIATMTQEAQFAAFAMDTMAQALRQQPSAAEICSSGANFYDYMIADTQAANETRREGFRTLKTLGMVTGGVLAVDSLVGAMGDRIGGDSVNSGRDTKQAGENIEDNSSSADSADVTDNTDNSDNSDNSETVTE